MANLIMPLKCTVDLDQKTRRVDIAEPLVQGDNQAHQIIMTVRRGSAAADLSGATCQCYVVLASKQTVLASAAISGNVVTATLNAACYAVPGRVSILLRLSVGGMIVTPLYLSGSVITGTADTYIDPNDIIPSLEELLAQIAAMEAATAAANTAAGKADAAASAANTAATNANFATQEATAAAAAANLVADQWDDVSVDLAMLPPDGMAEGGITQTPNNTVIWLNIPQGRVTNATLYVDDATTELMQRMPTIPEVGIDYAMETDTTELYQRVHGY